MDQIKLTGGADLLGRLLLAALFLFDGWTVVNNYGATADYLSWYGVPPILLVPALILQVGGGFLVLAVNGAGTFSLDSYLRKATV